MTEIISGSVQLYDHRTHAWTALAELADGDVISASCKRQCCPDGAFMIGGVYAAVLSMTCRLPGVNAFAVRGARITLYSQYSGESAPYCIGVFWVTNARRITGDLFSIDAQDAVGWLDTSSYNVPETSVPSSGGSGFGAILGDTEGRNLQAWLGVMTGHVNTLIQTQTGVRNLLTWENYDVSANNGEDYCNSHVYAYDENTGEPIGPFEEAAFALDLGTGAANSDSPRDFYRWIAELAGGFIYTNADGALTLGQFGQPEFGTAEVAYSDMEADSCEIADYIIRPYQSYAKAELIDGRSTALALGFTPDFTKNEVYIRYQIQSNPFLDGFAKWYVLADSPAYADLYTVIYNLWRMMGNYGGGYSVRPFRCTVHRAQRFHLGQKISLEYKNTPGGASQTAESIITSIVWTLRGGHKLTCGGEDSRVMADCLRASKADRAVREARNRCAALEKRMG